MIDSQRNPKPFKISDGLVVRIVKRNVVRSGDQVSLQTTLVPSLKLKCQSEDIQAYCQQKCRTAKQPRQVEDFNKCQTWLIWQFEMPVS